MQERKKLLKKWNWIKQICENQNNSDYKWWGGKGIKVEWKTFNEFYTWAINNNYYPGAFLIRQNKADNFSSDNCRWDTKAGRTNIVNPWGLGEMSLSQAVKKYSSLKSGFSVRYRMKKYGWDLETALTTPPRPGWYPGDLDDKENKRKQTL